MTNYFTNIVIYKINDYHCAIYKINMRRLLDFLAFTASSSLLLFANGKVKSFKMTINGIKENNKGSYFYKMALPKISWLTIFQVIVFGSALLSIVSAESWPLTRFDSTGE